MIFKDETKYIVLPEYNMSEPVAMHDGSLEQSPVGDPIGWRVVELFDVYLEETDEWVPGHEAISYFDIDEKILAEMLCDGANRCFARLQSQIKRLDEKYPSAGSEDDFVNDVLELFNLRKK